MGRALQIEAVGAAPSESAEQVSAAAGPVADATSKEPSQKKLRYAQRFDPWLFRNIACKLSVKPGAT